MVGAIVLGRAISMAYLGYLLTLEHPGRVWARADPAPCLRLSAGTRPALGQGPRPDISDK